MFNQLRDRRRAKWPDRGCLRPRPWLRFARAGLMVFVLMWSVSSGAIATGAELLETIGQQRTAVYRRAQSSLKGARAERPNRDRIRPIFDPSRQYFYVPPARAGMEKDGGGAGAGAGPSAMDPSAGSALFSLAQEALARDDGALAYRLAHETLYFTPDHADARRWLGLPPADSQAISSTTVRRGRRRHTRLGWPAGGYFQVASPHFQITTNDEEAQARQLARTLEELSIVWQQLFFECGSKSAVLKARDAGRARRRRRGIRHQVVMFRDRAEYVRHVGSIEPKAELTRGYYHAPSRTAYFVGGDQPSVSTWRHEATHQLFHENASGARTIGDRQNFWIVEGVAMYMESLQHCRQWVTVGGLEADRLQFARFRALREGFYVPCRDLAGFDRDTLQNDSRIRRLYSQAAGLTHFLMDGQNGRYRRSLMKYVCDVYERRDSIDSLTESTGLSWAELDQQYREYLDVDDRDLQQLDRDIEIRQLCLGGTSVTNVGFASLPSLDRVTWLDLFGTRLTDEGTMGLSRATELTQLNLERTQISDQTLARLRPLLMLQQLDLSDTQISDAGLKSVGELSRLESLWLTNTQLTDRGLGRLLNLKRLKVLDLTGTRTTPAARRQLLDALPHLRSER